MTTDTASPLHGAGEFGAQVDGDGKGADQSTRFALYSSVADAVELCLFDAEHNEVARHELAEHNHVWRAELPGIGPGQRYGYRVHGPYDPARGLYANPNKLLLDPWARQLDGKFVWDPAVTCFTGDDPLEGSACLRDSAPYVPKAVVPGLLPALRSPPPRRAWRDAVIYEVNVRGYTMRHPELTEAERGRFAGLANGQILDYLKALGITSVELLPVHAFIDERFLHESDRRNYWGYNTLNFFTPAGRYANDNAVVEFREMVDAIHDAGLEVILDVVYNHTAETDEFGPTLSFRGIDNGAYYRTLPDAPGRYVNDTGCGNTINADEPIVQALVVDSLEYWHDSMGVDGFRFDLAPVLGRHADGFAADHPLLRAIEHSPILQGAHLIAEPWDIGPGGYQAGAFSGRWAEWNDEFRDATRRFWRGDAGQAGDFARVVHGTAVRYEHKGNGPLASVNFVTSHDGYTLADLVSFEQRHNEANGQNNEDGHAHNFSCNYGHEGPTDDPAINKLRRRQRLNMLATLMVSGGVPMLLAGDEFGHSQQGNNNAYCQDNELAWLDWSERAASDDFVADAQQWLTLRRSEPLLRPEVYKHGHENEHGMPDVAWLQPDGTAVPDDAWTDLTAFALIFADPRGPSQLAVLFNAAADAVTFHLPGRSAWQHCCATGTADVSAKDCRTEAFSVAVLRSV
ncbi:MAG: glycogen debranching protein GlgX [Gammaproteobacteria bacterium]|nr:glycogen debranching protein GlgX [Gammaproteobacteria bacterium]NND55429.1 glycogen debranching protein GlgX [Gammaproteobacteria bacterium]